MAAGTAALILNCALAFGLMLSFLAIYYFDRSQRSMLWFIGAFLLAFVTPVMEFIIPYLDDTRPARIAIFTTHLGSLGLFVNGIARHYGRPLPLGAASVLYLVSVPLFILTMDLPRDSTARMLINQVPYGLMVGIAIPVLLPIARRGFLEKLLLAGAAFDTAQFFVRPFIARAVNGMGESARSYLASDYATLTLILFAIGLLWVSICMLLIGIRDMMLMLRAGALTDPLTGLLNRRGMVEALARIERRGQNRTRSVIVTDIDRFKAINDRFGHGAGDEVLCRFACLLRTMTGEDDLVVRLGGEEFAILPANANAAACRLLAEGIRTAFGSIEHECLSGGKVTASFGVTTGDGDETTDALIARADALLYKAKQSGRDRTISDPAPSEMIAVREAASIA